MITEINQTGEGKYFMISFTLESKNAEFRCLGGSVICVLLLVSAQVMILWFMSLSPTSGSTLTAWSLPGILSLPLSLPFLCSLCVSK